MRTSAMAISADRAPADTPAAPKPPSWDRFIPGAPGTPTPGTPYAVWSRSTGWPASAMIRFRLDTDATTQPLGVLDRGLTLTRAAHGRTARVLPLRPRWPGFLPNTALYAAAAWCCIAPLILLRRALRRRHNHCLTCAYNLAGITTSRCPECGTPSRQPAPQTLR